MTPMEMCSSTQTIKHGLHTAPIARRVVKCRGANGSILDGELIPVEWVRCLLKEATVRAVEVTGKQHLCSWLPSCNRQKQIRKRGGQIIVFSLLLLAKRITIKVFKPKSSHARTHARTHAHTHIHTRSCRISDGKSFLT